MKPLHRIMCIDDDADIRAIVKHALTRMDAFDVALCASCADALATVDAFAPQLILLDVVMPVVDGLATLVKLREHSTTSNVPVLFLSAIASDVEREALLSRGVIGVIAKPFRLAALPQEIRKYWERLHESAE